MYPAPFEYVAPDTQEQVLALLGERGDDAKVLAGGQSLMPMMNLRLVQPALVIDVNRIPSPAIATDDGTLVLPGATRYRVLGRDPLVARHAPVLAQAARSIGNIRVQSLGTIGGSVAHADPAAELPCVLTALDAEVVLASTGGQRTVPASQFFLTYLTTARQPDELVTGVRVPGRTPGTGHAFTEFARRAHDFAVVLAAARVELDDDQRCRRVSLVLGGVEDRPLALGQLTAPLAGEHPTAEALEDVARRARDEVSPHDDVHGTAAFRRQLAETLSREVLHSAVAAAKGADI